MNKDLEEIESNRVRGQPRAQYQGINKIRKGYQPRQEFIEDKEGNMLVIKDAIKDRWVEYFQELLNRPEPEILPNIQLEAEIPQEEELPTREETLREIKNLRNNKASGIDGIPAELIKYGGDRMDSEIVRIVHTVWNEEIMPEIWEEGEMVSIHKKNKRRKCENYRGINLLSIGYKILAKLIYRKYCEICDREIGDYQADFREERSTIDQILILRQILEK